MIEAINDSNGNLTTDRDNIEKCFLTYFRTIFTSQKTQNIDDTTATVKDKLTMTMIEHLEAPFTEEEVFQAFTNMKGLAAPGPDGLPTIFYHTHWDIIGHDITYEVL